MKRLMIRLGFHGKAHLKASLIRVDWMHNNGLGA